MMKIVTFLSHCYKGSQMYKLVIKKPQDYFQNINELGRIQRKS